MKKVDNSFKTRVCKAINENASVFEATLLNCEYLICSKVFETGYCIIKAHKGNYLHLTGVHTNLKADTFYEKAREGKITENDFDFRKVGVSEKSVKGSVREKIVALPSIANFFSKELRAEYNFVKNIVSCNFATTDQQTLTLGFVKNGNPRTLMKGNQLHEDKSEKVDCVLKRSTETSKQGFTEIVYGDIDALSVYWENIESLLSDDIKALRTTDLKKN